MSKKVDVWIITAKSAGVIAKSTLLKSQVTKIDAIKLAISEFRKNKSITIIFKEIGSYCPLITFKDITTLNQYESESQKETN